MDSGSFWVGRAIAIAADGGAWSYPFSKTFSPLPA